MAITPVTATFSLVEFLGYVPDIRRTRVILETNVASGFLVDTTTGGSFRLSDAAVTITSAGVASFSVLPSGATGLNPSAYQINVRIDAANPATREREQVDLGWYSITAAADLKDLVATQYVPPTYLSSVTAALDVYVDTAASSATSASASASSAATSASAAASSATLAGSYIITDLGTTDGQSSALINTRASLTAIAVAKKSPPINVLDLGVVLDGTTDNAVNLQAAADQGRTEGRGLYVPKGAGHLRISSPVDIYTDLTCDGDFVMSSNTTATLRFQRTLTPVALTAGALGGLTAGSSLVTGLGGQKGTLFLSSTEHMIERNVGVGSFYFKQEVCEVIMADGTVSPQIELTYDSLATVTATLYPPEPELKVTRLVVHVDGTLPTNTSGFVATYRDTVFDDLKVLNETGLSTILQAVQARQLVRLTFNRAVIDGFFMADTAGYGIATYNTAFTTYNDCKITNCRHPISGRYNKVRVVSGGTFEGGFDDHWCWDMRIERAHSTVSASKSHLAIAGRDVRVKDCTFVGGRNVVGVREDTPELAGTVTIEGGSWRPSTGRPSLWVLGYTTTTLAAFAYGRIVQSPDRVLVKDLRIIAPDINPTILQVNGCSFTKRYWRDVELDGVRITGSAQVLVAVKDDKNSAIHPDDTTGPTITVRNMNFSAALVDHVLIIETGETIDSKGFVLNVRNCASIALKLPEGSGMKTVDVRDSSVVRVYRAATAANPFTGDYTFTSVAFLAVFINGTWLANFRNCVWSGALTIANTGMVSRVKAWSGNLRVAGATGVPTTLPNGYSNPTHYDTVTYRATAALNFGTIAENGSEDLTIAVPGAVLGDPVSLAPSTSLIAGFIPYAFVSAADVVTVRLHNVKAAADPGGGQNYTVLVHRSLT